MAQLAIKEHPTRGKEVIEILEMLGGKNLNNLDGASNMYYLIGLIVPKILGASKLELDKSHEQFTYFTLEEFEKKFPYKIGDKVMTDDGDKANIVGMVWDNDIDDVFYETQIGVEVAKYPKELLQPYKEENMEQRQYKELRMPLDDDDKLATEVTIDGNKILPPNGYLIGKITQVDNGMLVEYVKQQPSYPKTYKECCNILGIEDRENGYCGYKYELLGEFQKLYICRNAYWEIAGEEMGLDKPWKPDWGENDGGYRYCIHNQSNKIVLNNEWLGENYILSFPTAEMRDKFYENFKELIEFCKELL